MTISVRALWIVAVLTGVASAQHSGDIPPELVWNKLKGSCPASLDFAALRGKVVVVSLTDGDDFPIYPDDVVRWNEVAQNFQGEQVLFIQVVSGSEFLLDQALKQAEFQGCVLFDGDLKNRENFKVPSWTSVVIDQHGLIAGYSEGGPGELRRQMETGLLEAPPKPPEPRPFDPAAGLDPVPSYEVHISRAARGDPIVLIGLSGPDLYISKNRPLKHIILDLWDTPMGRIAFPEKLDEGHYNVTAHIPVADPDQLLQLVRQAVEIRLGLSVEKEERMQRMYVLRATGNPSPQLQPATGDEEESGGGYGTMIGTAKTMQDIAGHFQVLLNIPVVDETGLKGKYDYSASSKLLEPEATFDMAHQLGLELTPAERPIEMLVVRKIQ